MGKRVFVGGLHHESDTFNPITTNMDDIHVLRGKDLLCSNNDDSITGIIKTFEKAGIEVIPSLFARAVPNGEWDKQCYTVLRDELVSALEKSFPIDAVCLALHGAMRVKGIGKSESDLLSRIRSLCPDIPIICSLDMHATVTADMLEYADGFIGYKCAPHTDEYETGCIAAKITLRAMNGEKLHMAAVRIPMLIAGEQSETNTEPMKSLVKELRQLEMDEESVIAASYFLGFPWADSGDNGVTALVVASGKSHAEALAIRLAEDFWSNRDNFRFYSETYEPAECLEKAKESIKCGVYPVIISDSGDNPTAGSSQDVTNFLKLILKDKELCSLDPPLCYQAIYDPHVVLEAIEKGEGNILDVSLGAGFDKKTSTPIKAKARVISVKRDLPGFSGVSLALLDIGGIDVVVTDRHVGCYDPKMMEALGVDPSFLKVCIVKLGYLEPEIRAIAKRSLMALTDGSSNEVFSSLSYKNLPRPIFPLDDSFPFNPSILFSR